MTQGSMALLHRTFQNRSIQPDADPVPRTEAAVAGLEFEC